MSAALLPARQRVPRRARYLIPPGTPRRRETTAALSLLALLAGLLLAQVTLGLAVAFYAAGKLTRWRPAWLTVPAAAGLAWILTIGPAAALAGLTAAPRALAGVLFRQPDPARLARLGGLPVRQLGWFPGQFPAGLILAAVLAAAAWWLDWLHTDEWRLPAPRPGLLVITRRWLTVVFIRSGGVLSRTGASLGVVPATGRPAVIGWPEAERGVLVTGAAPAEVAGPAGQLAHAAIRLRKPVIVVDLAADPGLPALLAAACAAAGAPLLTFAAAGPGCYEPFPAGDPVRNAAAAAGMIDWAGLPAAARRAGQSVLADVFAVAGAVPANDGRAVLDDVVALLRPGALQARMDLVPGYWPGRAVLAGRVAASTARLAADPAAASGMAGQLASVRASPLGRWLGGAPPVDGHRISLPTIVRQRGIVLFSLDRAAYGPVADIIANLVARDIAGIFTGLGQAGMRGDGLAWFSRCETADPQALAALVTAGSGAGLATVLSTTSATAASGLAGQAGVLVVHRLADGTLASQLARLTGLQLVPAGPGPAGMVAAGPPDAPLPLATPPGTDWAPAVTGEAMCALRAGEFVLIRPGVADGVVPRAVSVPARIPRRRQPVALGRPAGGPRQAGPPGRPGRAEPPDWLAGRRGGGGPADWPAGRPGRAGPPTWASSGDGADQPLSAAPAGPPDAPHGAAPAATPGVPPWPNAPAWAAGQLRRDQTR